MLENFVPCLTTFSTASKKSRSEATFRLERMANMPACKRKHVRQWHGTQHRVIHTSVATDLSSAPVVFGHRRAIRSNRISRSVLILCEEGSSGQHTAGLREQEARITSLHESEGYARVLRCQVMRTPLVDPDVQVAARQGQVYQVCTSLMS